MATSPNYGWLEPDNTDLVKNGALAIRTLGNAIDTTMATMTPKSLVDAKGDLIAATANDTPARLAVGNNGETLVADSAASTGLRWQASAGINLALNSNFSIWQRGTSGSPSSNGGAYQADRWFGSRGSNTSLTVSQQSAGNLSVSPNQAFTSCARVLRTAGSTTTSSVDLGQMFETAASTYLAGQTVVLSAYIRKGANFSATNDALTMSIIEGTGTDQKQMDGGYTGQNNVVTGVKTLTTAWQRFYVTGTIATTATEITIKFGYTPTGTAGAADSFDITGVKLELGSVPTNWSLAGTTLQGELAACQRYYYRTASPTAYALHGVGRARSTTEGQFYIQNAVPMRVPASSVEFSSLLITDAVALNSGISAVTISQNSTLGNSLYTSGASGLTSGGVYFLGNNNSTSGYLGFSAEL